MGVGILWSSAKQVSLINFSQNHVNVDVSDRQRGTWRLTSVYGFSKRHTHTHTHIYIYIYIYIRFIIVELISMMS